MTRVELDATEVGVAIGAAVARQIEAAGAGRRNSRTGQDGSTWPEWRKHIVGAIAEVAVAKALGRYWHLSLGPSQGADVGRLHVRSTPYKNGHLVVYGGDPDDAIFVLVTGEPPALDVCGWIRGRDAKANPEWFYSLNGAYRPSHNVPRSALSPMPVDTLAPLDPAPVDDTPVVVQIGFDL